MKPSDERPRGRPGRGDLARLLAAGRPDLASALAAHLGYRWRAPEAPAGSSAGKDATDVGPADTAARQPLPIEAQALTPTPFWHLTGIEFSDDADDVEASPATPVPYHSWQQRPRTPPLELPLAPWPELRSRLGGALYGLGDGRVIDVPRCIEQIGRGRQLRRLPRERRRRWGRVLLIEDRSRRLTPFWRDQRRLRLALRRLLPPTALSRAVYHDGMDAPAAVGAAGRGRLPTPAPGTVVLVLGDLGCLASYPGEEQRIWRDLGHEWRDAGCHPVALVPAPAARWPRALEPIWRLLPWERPSSAVGDVGDLASRVQRLLRLVAPAARLEPGLLRALRRLLPDAEADAATEADLWQHPLLLDDASSAASLRGDDLKRLRQAFARDESPRLQARVMAVLRSWRGYLPEDIWFEELLSLGADAADGQAEDPAADPAENLSTLITADIDDARAYFNDFCGDNDPPDSIADLAWFQRVEQRAADAFWQDEQVGDALQRMAWRLHRDDPDYQPPAGFDPAAAPSPAGRSRRYRLWHRGSELVVELDRGGPLAAARVSKPVVGDAPTGGLLSRWRTRLGLGPRPADAPAPAQAQAPATVTEPSFASGSPLARFTSRNGLLQWRLDSVTGTSESKLLRLPAEPVVVHRQRPVSGAFSLQSDDYGRLRFETLTCPQWAGAIGRDGFGLWVAIAIERSGGAPVRQRLRWIPPGRFMMGSPKSEEGRYADEGPRHRVSLEQGYWLFDTPCTQALWEAVMEGNPSMFKDPERPVETVSWEEAKAFIEAINQKAPGLALSLPSEAQWEYACRAGTDTAIYTGALEILGENNAPALDPIAWYGGNSGKGFELDNGYDSSDWKERQYPKYKRAGTHPVGRKQPNPWGLYDMLGNVWEWVEDPWHQDYNGAPSDDRPWPQAPGDHGAERVFRGGGWRNYARSVRAASRGRYPPDDRFGLLGFRCARVQGREPGQVR